jgi:hypothetical protein
MTVCIYIIESANCEKSELHFEDRQVTHSMETMPDDCIDFNLTGKMITDVAAKFKTDVNVLFVDKEYANEYYQTERGKREFDIITKLKETCEFYTSDWFEFIREYIGFDDIDQHIFVSRKNFVNVYDMANFLQLPIKNNYYYAWGINSLEAVVNSRSYYNIFSANDKDKQVDTLGNPQFQAGDEESLKWIVEHGVKQVKELIRAGVLARERFMQCDVEPWATNVYSYFSKGVIIEYDLFLYVPPNDCPNVLAGESPQKVFNEHCNYRYILTDYMCRVLCKYGLEFNKIITCNGNHQTINFDFLLA